MPMCMQAENHDGRPSTRKLPALHSLLNTGRISMFRSHARVSRLSKLNPLPLDLFWGPAGRMLAKSTVRFLTVSCSWT